MGIFVSSLIIIVLKLLATTMQQKCIGQPLSKKTWVLNLVRIHTPFMQGLKNLIKTPHLNRKKVAILVGGPDWPTSVLTGITRLNLFPILFATIPCYFGSTLLAISGAMMTQPQTPGIKSIFALSLALAAACNMFFGMMATVYITRYLSDPKNFKEIKKECDN